MIKSAKLAIAASLSLVCSLVSAEDIDLFMGVGSRVAAVNVLIVLDSSANWDASIDAPNCYYKDNGVVTAVGPGSNEQGKKMAIEKCALYNLIDALPINANGTAKYNIGIMLFNESPASHSGGYPRKAFTPLTTASKAILKGIIKAIDIDGDEGNNAAFAKSLYEAYLYFTKGVPYMGTAGSKWDQAAVSAGHYVLPVVGGEDCGTSGHIVFIANGGPGEATNNEARDLLAGVGGNTTEIAYSKSYITDTDQANWADEYTRFLAGVDTDPRQNVVSNVKTHGIAVTGASSDTLYPNFIREMAKQGGGSFYAANSVDLLLNALVEIFGKIEPINTAYSAVSLPVSVNTQGVYLNQVFVGMFRPDRDAKPRWNGNLKQYQIAVAEDGTTLKLADSKTPPEPAIDATSGFLDPCAVSFWTPWPVPTPQTDEYWDFKKSEFPNACKTVAGAASSNSPDGDAVEKGAAGYRLRRTAPGDRVVKTCTGTCDAMTNLTLTAFATTNSDITVAKLGVAGEADPNQARLDLIDWVRGSKNRDADLQIEGGVDPGAMRPSVHGDVVHSRPLAVDYGADTGVVVFYGSNDGMLRAVAGGKTISDGDELWSFVAPEHFGKLKRLWKNEPAVDFPAPAPGVGNHKDYFFDGSIGGIRTDSGAVWIYPTMRRGGRSVYAFDVSAPDLPALMWRHGCPHPSDDTGCDSGFDGLGQTWAEVAIFSASGYLKYGTEAPQPIAIFGGGYDTCEDVEPNTCTAPKGNHIFVVDAETGLRLNTLDTVRSVAADVTLVDRDGDGRAELGYAVDTGGNLYRVNIGTAAPADWTITKVAALGCDAPPCQASGTYNRKFLYAPEVVVVGNGINAILVGSGDREHPLDTNGAVQVDNAFFMVKDKPDFDTWLTSEIDNCGGEAAICRASLLQVAPEGSNPTAEDLNASKGWYLAFGTDATAGGTTIVHNGEQVVTSAIVVGGVVYFSTHTPTAETRQQCGPNLGTARAYAVNFWNVKSPDGTSDRFDDLVGGGLAPSPVGGIVDIGGRAYPVIIGGRQLGGGASSGLEVQNAGLVVSGVRSRQYWYIGVPR